MLKERGRLLDRPKYRLARQFGADISFEREMRLIIVAVQRDAVVTIVLGHLKSSVVMETGKHPPAQPCVEPRRRVSSGDKNTLPAGTLLVPFHGDSVGGILGADTKGHWQPARP